MPCFSSLIQIVHKFQEITKFHRDRTDLVLSIFSHFLSILYVIYLISSFGVSTLYSILLRNLK